jgi:D-sedoheptulose 7-phosphate isomerase
MQDLIRAQIQSSIKTKQKVAESLVPQIEKAAHLMILALKKNQKILFFGNGGSASDAQHMAAEFVGRFLRERRALPSIALTTDTSILTAVSNDYGFNQVFSRQIEALGQKGDVAVGISTSGDSENVLRAIKTAKEKGLGTIGLSGQTGGKMKDQTDIFLAIPSTETSRIQEAHILIGHILCDLVDRSFSGKP